MRTVFAWLNQDVLSALLPRGVSTIDPPIANGESLPATRFRTRFTLLGLLLALGAPVGAVILRLFIGELPLAQELKTYSFFYWYMLAGTQLVFGISGYLAGTRADEVAWERDKFQGLSEHDDLTGLFNSRAFWDRYRRAVERSEKFREPLSLLMIDIDQLKAVNDQAGHRFGNKVLKHVAEAISKAKRSDDVAARWGGDEFVVLMSGAPPASAVRLAEDILMNVRERPVANSRDERLITVTIGVASRQPDEPADRLFDRADQALYQAKHQGGNRYA